MKRCFQITLLATAAIPFTLRGFNFLGDANAYTPETGFTARHDSQMRFSGVWSMLPFFLVIWIVRTFGTGRPMLIGTLCAAVTVTAAVGPTRVYSAFEHGLPAPLFFGIIAFEFGVLAFIPWYDRIMRQVPSPDSPTTMEI